jgi:hypothetical protein
MGTAVEIDGFEHDCLAFQICSYGSNKEPVLQVFGMLANLINFSHSKI